LAKTLPLLLLLIVVIAFTLAKILHARHHHRPGTCDICGAPVAPGERECEDCWDDRQW
jgi:hypothetical protein